MPVRAVWRKTGGSEYEQRWWGPADDVRAIFNLLVNTGAQSVTFDQQQGSVIGICTAVYAGVQNNNDLASEVMTIEFSDQTLPLHQNPSFIGIDNDTIQSLEENIKNGDPNPYSDSSLAVYKYYSLRSRGVESYRVQLPIVTWSRIVGPKYPTHLDLEDVGTIYNTSQMVDQLGATVLWSVPTLNVGVQEGDATIFKEGWLKTAAVSYTADGQDQLIIRGEYGIWAINAYTFAF